MLKDKFIITLDEERYNLIIDSLIAMKNNLISQGRSSNPVDEVLIKLIKSKKKYI